MLILSPVALLFFQPTFLEQCVESSKTQSRSSSLHLESCLFSLLFSFILLTFLVLDSKRIRARSLDKDCILQFECSCYLFSLLLDSEELPAAFVLIRGDGWMKTASWEIIFRGIDTTALLTEWTMAEMVLNPDAHKKLHEELEIFHMDMLMELTPGMKETMEMIFRGAEIVLNVDAQKKLHKELEMVVGKNRSVSHSNICKLPYLQVVLKETLIKNARGKTYRELVYQSWMKKCFYAFARMNGIGKIGNMEEIGREQQPAEMEKPETEKDSSSTKLDLLSMEEET